MGPGAYMLATGKATAARTTSALPAQPRRLRLLPPDEIAPEVRRDAAGCPPRTVYWIRLVLITKAQTAQAFPLPRSARALEELLVGEPVPHLLAKALAARHVASSADLALGA